MFRNLYIYVKKYKIMDISFQLKNPYNNIYDSYFFIKTIFIKVIYFKFEYMDKFSLITLKTILKP